MELQNEETRLAELRVAESKECDPQGTVRYDKIPAKLLRGKILEIGARWGQYQNLSIHQERFLSSDYHGIDIEYESDLIDIEKADVLEWDTTEKYDVILALDVIEHIPYRDWPALFEKMRRWLKDRGHLIVSCPYKEKIADFSSRFLKDYRMCHVVFGIDKRFLHRWMPNATFDFTWFWEFPRVEGERLIKSILRAIKRILTRNKWAFVWIPRRRHIISFWQKTDAPILEW